MFIELTEKEVDDAREMFMLHGWSAFMDQVREMVNDCTIDNCKDADDLWFQKGRLATLRTVLAYEDMILHAEREIDGGFGIESSLLQ